MKSESTANKVLAVMAIKNYRVMNERKPLDLRDKPKGSAGDPRKPSTWALV